ncbi:hypothetical protein T439DRAFT_337233 [Meredithblackwellia eburnea MCA 4105]
MSQEQTKSIRHTPQSPPTKPQKKPHAIEKDRPAKDESTRTHTWAKASANHHKGKSNKENSDKHPLQAHSAMNTEQYQREYNRKTTQENQELCHEPPDNTREHKDRRGTTKKADARDVARAIPPQAKNRHKQTEILPGRRSQKKQTTHLRTTITERQHQRRSSSATPTRRTTFPGRKENQKNQ